MDVRLGWIDGLILAASLGLGLAAWATDPKELEAALGLGDTQAEYEEVMAGMRLTRQQVEPPGEGENAKHRFVRWRGAVLGFGAMVLPFLSVGVGIATFRHRAARSRRALRCAGITSTAVAATMAACLMANEWALRRSPTLETGYLHNPFLFEWGRNATYVSLALAALWFVMVASRGWRIAPNGADRLGRWIGGLWIGYAVVGVLLASWPLV